ncbi:SRPBCC family protein [Arthrobacter sp. H14-L1]|uniref:SRPBCC family protein n=1 Tax=Arthrobacter sp. H14-L1 TaxID=2996697 RepID=UPI00226FF689|nr:SRPBCC family protein [Arthrobacter sp. H14-L1]MCY0906279.1 SRPBCC family protein [Arthrobacter sp. H14-L1]
MKRTFTVSESILIRADPFSLYERISDVTRMGQWSPENLGATVHCGQTGGGGSEVEHEGGVAAAYVGMVFDGRNKRGRFGWTTRCTVTAADPGLRFEFRVHAIGAKTPRLRGPIATWEYRFEAADTLTRVTESWTDDRRGWPDLLARGFDAVVTGGRTFAQFQSGNIKKTLKTFKATVEA